MKEKTMNEKEWLKWKCDNLVKEIRRREAAKKIAQNMSETISDEMHEIIEEFVEKFMANYEMEYYDEDVKYDLKTIVLVLLSKCYTLVKDEDDADDNNGKIERELWDRMSTVYTVDFTGLE